MLLLIFSYQYFDSIEGGVGTRSLLKADVPLISNAVCSYLMDRTIPATEVCAGRKHGGVDSCQVKRLTGVPT